MQCYIHAGLIPDRRAIRFTSNFSETMTFAKTIGAILVTMIANLAVLFGWEKTFTDNSFGGMVAAIVRPESAFGWNLLTAFAIAGMTALLFHSLAVPGSKVQRGIYVGIAAGVLSGILSSAPWLAKIDAPTSIFWKQVPMLLAMGIVGGVVYSLFYWKQKAGH